MEVIERPAVIAFRHERVAVIHQAASVLWTLNRHITPECFLRLPNLVALKRSESARAEN